MNDCNFWANVFGKCNFSQIFGDVAPSSIPNKDRYLYLSKYQNKGRFVKNRKQRHWLNDYNIDHARPCSFKSELSVQNTSFNINNGSKNFSFWILFGLKKKMFRLFYCQIVFFSFFFAVFYLKFFLVNHFLTTSIL